MLYVDDPTAPDDTRGVRLWLLTVFAMITLMVAVGGITRLTGSGLSMVEWHPLMGTIPPLDEAAWQATFAKYKLSPQYLKVNSWMQLDDFKRIFMWEYLHRLLGRTIGLVFFVPMVWLWRKGSLQGVHRRRALIAFFLGGSQGLLGWFMVKSGLVDRPEVSHLRLAAHLSLAFFVAQYVLWMALRLKPKPPLSTTAPSWMRPLTFAAIGLIALQIVYGAFMAGTRAGYLFATFPDMNGSYWPSGVLHMEGGVVGNALHNPVFIHVLHRLFAVVATAAVIALGVVVVRSFDGMAKRAGQVLLVVVALQFLFGVGTVMMHVAIPMAVVHQLGGLALLSCATWLAFLLGPTPTASDVPAAEEQPV